MATARELVEQLKADRDALRLLAAELAKDPDIQLTILRGTLGNVATKEDLEKAVRELRGEVERVRVDLIHYVDKRVDAMQWMLGIGFSILAIIVALAGIL